MCIHSPSSSGCGRLVWALVGESAVKALRKLTLAKPEVRNLLICCDVPRRRWCKSALSLGVEGL